VTDPLACTVVVEDSIETLARDAADAAALLTIDR